MGDSDNENEAFVQNVMHELSAFDVDKKSKPPDDDDTATENANASNVKENPPPDKTSDKTETGSSSSRQPSRIIRLSRPANPYTSRSLPSVPSSASETSSKNASSISTTSMTSTSSLRTTPSPAPGSRLAALNRPGSPMHKILSRAQSPALAAAARLSRQASSDNAQPADTASSTTPSSENNQTNAIINADGNNESNDSQATKTSGGSTTETSANQTRSILPPRINSSSSMSGSILLRRPQSPLQTGKSQLLINTHASVENNSQTPNSPLSTNSPRSPRNSQTDDAQDSDNQIHVTTEAEKIAIRNKLRANSFRLKDLLTQRPFTKRRDTPENGSKDDLTRSQDESGPIEDTKGSITDKSNVEADSKAGAPARSRWRTEASSLSITGTRSRISERTSSLISSRSFRNRALNSDRPSTWSASESGDGKTSTNDTAAVSDRITDRPDSSENHSNETERSSLPVSAKNVDSSGSEPILSVGATLLRSPRTRINKSNVPSNSVSCSVNSLVSDEKEEPLASQPVNANVVGDRVEMNGNRDLSDDKSDYAINDANDIGKVKAIFDLEKETEANLVFNSEIIGQEKSAVTSPDMDITDSGITVNIPNVQSHSSVPCTPVSKYANSGVIINEPSAQNHGSVPSTPVSSLGMRPSKSYDNTADADFMNSSTALKRSFAVTDLDKAMVDRDQQKLNLIFKDEKAPLVDNLRSPEPLVTDDTSKETDIDARHDVHQRMNRSPLRHRKTAWSMDDKPSTPTSPPGPLPVGAVAQTVYKPNVNLEDAVKWPIDIPGKLDFRKMEVFEGQMLLNWLTGSIDKAHYLRLVMTKHDISVIACQICTCLLAAGVIKQLEGKEPEAVFKTDCMYYWMHTQSTNKSAPAQQDVNKLTPMWPPTQEDSMDKPGLKYTEADHQAAMVTMRQEYKQDVEKMQSEHEGVLDRARLEYQNRLQKAEERIVLLQQEVEKYKNLAGLEQLSQKALSEANRARLEAGLPVDDLIGYQNGYYTPSSNTPSTSQYHTPAMTPDGIPVETVLNNSLKSASDLYEEGSIASDLTSERSQDNLEGEGSEAESIPVPPPPPPPPGSIPAPPPLPDAMLQRKVSAKPVVNPKQPMKPLFWQRIQVHEVKTPKNKELLDKRLIWEEIQEENIDVTELDQLFSKTNSEYSKKFSFNKPKSKSKEVAKVIAPKRSQVVGILLSSLRIEMSDIENAILNFDTSLISEEKLRQIYECRCDDDELKKLKEHVRKHPDITLDKPDQFLYDLSLIPDHAERIFCFIFREAFQDSISVIETKLSNLRLTCQSLISSIHLKRILGLVLAMGNYMNGGSKRGQADGFGIDILPKLKDVKSKDTSVNLLYYTVQQYIKKYEKQDAGTDRVKLPLPDPSDLNQGTQVNFTELEKELKRIETDFAAARKRADKVMQSAKEHFHLQPFKDIMMEFFERGEKQYQEQLESLEDGKKVFRETVIFFCVKPKSGDKEVTPDYFFSLWSSFCQDFKDTWKREQQRIIKQKIKENEIKVKRMQENLAKKPVRTRTRKAGGLKDRMAKKGLLES